MRIAYFSTDDINRPRNLVILEGLRQLGHDVACYNFNAWEGVKDKAFATGFRQRLRVLARYLAAYPIVIARYLFSPPHDVVIVPYMGLLDVLVVMPLARLKKVPVVWDAFISIYNTVVEDRKLLAAAHPAARLLYRWEKLALSAADLVLLDTQAHVRYFQEQYGLASEKLGHVLIGARGRWFEGARRYSAPAGRPLRVLFFGTFIPLHGLEVILEAAAASAPEEIEWYIVGRGQEEQRLEERWKMESMPQLHRIRWMEQEELIGLIDDECHLCLGIFGTTDKAARVIPNKLFEIVARGRPVVTRDSPAIRELFDGNEPGIWLVPQGDASALRRAVSEAAAELPALHGRMLFEGLREKMRPQAIAAAAVALIEERLFAGSTQPAAPAPDTLTGP